MHASEERLIGAWWALRVGLGAGLLIAGADKFFDKLATWGMYLSPLAERLLPFSGDTFMRLAGCGEMAIGMAVLTRWTRLGSYVMAAWLLGIAANLAAAGTFWDLAMRDVEISLAAFTLGRLTAWREALTSAGLGAGRSWADAPPGTRSVT